MLFQVLTVVVLSLSLAACGGGHQHDHGTDAGKSEAATTHSHDQSPAYTSAYVCPMHCEGSGSDKAGQCPVCGMDYVALEEHVKDGHSHE